MFSSALCYTTLRLLDEKAEGSGHGPMEKARKWILDHGGVTMIPTWGKFWLSVSSFRKILCTPQNALKILLISQHCIHYR